MTFTKAAATPSSIAPRTCASEKAKVTSGLLDLDYQHRRAA